MPRNSSGTYTPPAGTSAVGGATISSSAFNNLVDDISSAITGSVGRDGTGGMTANLAMGGNRITGLSAGTAGTDAATKAQVDAITSGVIQSGTKVAFFQTTAPGGWTKITDSAYNDKAIRIVTGSASSGGSVGFSTLFSRTSVDGLSLTQAQLPNINFTHALTGATHTHGVGTYAVSSHSHGVGTLGGSTSTDGAHTHSYNDKQRISTTTRDASGGVSVNQGEDDEARTTGSSGSHSHTLTMTGNTGSATPTLSGSSEASGALAISGTVSSGGSGTAHSHGLDMRVAYVDCIVASKD